MEAIRSAEKALEALAPDFDLFMQWREAKPALLAEEAALREAIEKHRIAVLGHQGEIDVLKRAKARAEDEVQVATNDRNRVQREYEALMLKVQGLRKSLS
jgi:hypothetical protein